MKVYLGKSYQSNPDLVVATSNFLKRNNIEIARYEGGAYDPDLIIKHNPDLVIIIPPHFTPDELNVVEDLEDNSFYMGKGNDSEARKLPDKTYFVLPRLDFTLGDKVTLVASKDCNIEIKEHEPRRLWSKVSFFDQTPFILLDDLINDFENENMKENDQNHPPEFNEDEFLPEDFL